MNRVSAIIFFRLYLSKNAYLSRFVHISILESLALLLMKKMLETSRCVQYALQQYVIWCTHASVLEGIRATGALLSRPFTSTAFWTAFAVWKQGRWKLRRLQQKKNIYEAYIQVVTWKCSYVKEPSFVKIHSVKVNYSVTST